MKKKYFEPTLDIDAFETENILTDSGIHTTTAVGVEYTGSVTGDVKTLKITDFVFN